MSQRCCCLITLIVGLCLLFTGGFADPTEKCQPRNVTYSISDSAQCDLYYDCLKNGKLTERMCDDGFVFSEAIRMCEYPHNVDCSKRPKLQPSRSTDPNCERSNGFYPFPAAISCAKFYHCLEGVAYEKTCPEGVIFDVARGTCMHPDLSHRKDCAAHTVLNFKCPNMNQRFSKLKFGDHDRHAHPDDCRKFYICLMDGKPRLGGCPIGKVFNSKTGFCVKPKHAEDNCKDYYTTGAGKVALNNDVEAMKKMEKDALKAKNGTQAQNEKDDDDVSVEVED